MGFRTGSYATIWGVEDKGNFAKVQLSTSKKNKQTDAYETDFSGFVNFVGAAREKVLPLQAKDRIKIGDCDVTTSYNKETKVTYTNYAIFSFEVQDGNQSVPTSTETKKTKTTKKPAMDLDESNEDSDLPF